MPVFKDQWDVSAGPRAVTQSSNEEEMGASAYPHMLGNITAALASNVPERPDVFGIAILGYN